MGYDPDSGPYPIVSIVCLRQARRVPDANLLIFGIGY